jgi:hypothetical protein
MPQPPPDELLPLSVLPPELVPGLGMAPELEAPPLLLPLLLTPPLKLVPFQSGASPLEIATASPRKPMTVASQF